MAEAGLTLHPEKTRVVDATRKGGFEFLSWHIERSYKWPRKKSIQKFKDSVRAGTKRNNGEDMKTIIKRLNLITRGWGDYFRGGVQKVPESLDQWIRMRLSQHPAKAGQTQRPGPRSGSQPVSKRLVRSRAGWFS
ncbi:MAG: hypothetical protein RLZZ522_101 [Verrucomicrobiota bacterium]